MNSKEENRAKTAKNDKIEIATSVTDQNVYWNELIRTFTLTMITMAQNMKLPSMVRPPS
jgi:hypothetical protein